MPQRKLSSRRFLTRLALFSFASYALVAMGRRSDAPRAEDADWEPTGELNAERFESTRPKRTVHLAETNEWADWDVEVEKAPKPKRRLATTLAFVTLFFAGASLTAIAGDEAAQLASGDSATTETATTDTTVDESVSSDDEATAGDSSSDSSGEDVSGDLSGSGSDDSGSGSDTGSDDVSVGDDSGSEAGEGSGAGADEAGDSAGEGSSADDDTGSGAGGSSDQGGNADGGNAGSGGSGSGSAGGGNQVDSGSVGETDAASSDAPALLPEDVNDSTRPTDPEASDLGLLATVWLHRTLPDPTPPAKRLAPAFARQLAAEAHRSQLDWALLLGVLRAQGHDGRVPATAQDLHLLARQLARFGAGRDEWAAVLAFSGRTSFADEAQALARYDRAAGLRALVTGLEAAKPALERRVLTDPKLVVYPGGRSDIQNGRVDVRVLLMLEYLAQSYDEVTVSCLITGHGLYARPGVVSAHVYGQAADIAALNNTPIAGHQEEGGLTEHAVRDLLFLPAELQPQQVISLIGLGGPSFPLANHYDHIHIGY